MSDDQAPDSLTEQIRRYRQVRETIERSTLPLATSVDGHTFELQASLHGLALAAAPTSRWRARAGPGWGRSPTSTATRTAWRSPAPRGRADQYPRAACPRRG